MKEDLELNEEDRERIAINYLEIATYMEVARNAKRGGNTESAREYYERALESTHAYKDLIQEVLNEYSLEEAEEESLTEVEEIISHWEDDITAELGTL